MTSRAPSRAWVWTHRMSPRVRTSCRLGRETEPESPRYGRDVLAVSDDERDRQAERWSGAGRAMFAKWLDELRTP